jgi:hypothetical protein
MSFYRSIIVNELSQLVRWTAQSVDLIIDLLNSNNQELCMIKRAMDFVRTALPDLALCGLVTITAYALERIESAVLGRTWLESLVLSILIGTAIRTFHRLDARLEPGIQVGAKTAGDRRGTAGRIDQCQHSAR